MRKTKTPFYHDGERNYFHISTEIHEIMSFLRIKNIKVAGISACVPETIVRNTNSVVNNVHYDAESFVKSTGVAQRHMSEELTTSDLCYKATNKLLDDLGWERESIDVMLFVSQSQDFILPATSCILQDRLKLSKNCFCEDISLGCSGWTYGIDRKSVV